jgi:peptidoglycan/xylan/chitin deacetylase (PgdA/CDA1 family)
LIAVSEKRIAIQIITYHALAAAHVPDDVYTVTLSEFEQQLDLMRQSGVPIASALPESWFENTSSSGHQIGITFDDGLKSDLLAAALLEKNGLSGIFFISTANIGKAGYLDQADIRQLETMGMHVGSHSHDHVRLNTLSIENARQQMRVSKEQLESILLRPVDALAFPGGGYDRSVISAAFESGFRYLMTTDWGFNRIPENASRAVFKRNNILHGMQDRDFLRLITLQSDRQRHLIFHSKQVVRKILPENVYRKIRGFLG